MPELEKRTGVTDEDVERLLGVFAKLKPSNLWSRVTKDDFTVRRFAMGFVNDIACCELTEKARARFVKSPQDASAIVVKFVPKEMFFEINRLEFIASNTILSEQKITPRLIYADDKCMINEFVESRNYKQEDDLEPETVKQLARLLARVHSAQPPISIEGFNTWNNMFGEDSDRYEDPMFDAIINGKYMDHLEKETPEIKEKYYSLFSEMAALDFKENMKYTQTLTKKSKSPLVFSHTDFNRGNRLVRETKNEDGSTKKDIFLVDFDYSTWNYRGIDLGRYFSNYRHLDDMFGNEGFPSDEEMKLFLEEYRSECGRIQGQFYLDQPENSLEQLIKESKVFTLMAYSDYGFCLMMYNMDPTGPRKDYFLQSAFNRFSAFKTQKQVFTEDGTISSILSQNGTA